MIEKIIISDTSCLIAFDRINKLELLNKLFPKIITTPEIANEFGKKLPSWLKTESVKNIKRKKELENYVDSGEASAIALALETKNCMLIVDEKKGRKIASELGIEIIGTLKILLLAKEKGQISSLKEIINELQFANFRLSKKIIHELLKLSGEL